MTTRLRQSANNNNNKHDSGGNHVEEDWGHPGEINPFEQELEFDLLRRVEVALCAVFLLPIRVFLTAVILALGLVICHVASFGLPTTPQGHYVKPILGWRRKLYDSTIPILARLWLYVLGFWYIPYKGHMASRDEAPILVMAPHSSFLDGLVPLILPYTYSAVTRFENRQVPLLGVLVNVVAPIFIRRSQKESREVAQREIVKRTGEKDWPPIMIFVEGTCTNRKALLPFKAGAFAPGAPVQPIIIRYDGSPHCIWSLLNPLYLIFLVYCTFTNHTSIEFLDPIIPTDEEKEDARLYSENVRRKMAEYLNIPLSTYGYRDVIKMQQCLQERSQRHGSPK